MQETAVLGTHIDELAALGLHAGADFDVAVAEPGLGEVHVTELIPDRREVLDARRAGVPGRAQQRRGGQEPRAQREHAPPAARRSNRRRRRRR